MPDRIIRDELYRSIRWLDLPTDTHRLVFVGLVTMADDYGNLEGGPRRLYRWMVSFTQIKAEADSVKLMSDLQDADLVRRYEVENREYWHIPRFKNSRRYWSRKCPPSPYKESDKTETKQHDTKNPNADLPQTCANLSGGVGVGVGELPSRGKRKPKPETDPAMHIRRSTWQAYSDAYEFRHGAAPLRDAKANSAIKAFCNSVPHSEAPQVAAFYVQNSNSFYVSKKHPPTLLALDAAKLRTEWVTGQQTTQTEAIQADKTAARKNVFIPLINEAMQREKTSKQ